MAKLTVNGIKKQIAALEAMAARLAEEETNAAVGKVRALMNQLGVTLEHLSSAMTRKGAEGKKAIAGGKTASAKRAGKGVVKYRDLLSGATWTGYGRAPSWIAGAANRDAFLVSNGTGRAPETGANAPAAKKRVAKKATARKATAKKATAKNAVAKKSTAKQVVTRKATAKKADKTPAKKVAKKKAASAAVAAPAAVDSSGASAA